MRAYSRPSTRGQLEGFLAEDIGRGDVTGALFHGDAKIVARIVSRKGGGGAVVAGVSHARTIFGLRNCRAQDVIRDGYNAYKGDTIIKITGRAQDVLACERTALNLLSRMSGIATETARMAARLPEGVHIYATRKTAPGLRHFDKEAVEIGGGKRHRMGLFGAIMIKDNHIAAEMASRGVSRQEAIANLIQRAQRRSRRRARPDIEVEVENVGDAVLAARTGATTIMLDNFGPARIRSAVSTLAKLNLRDRVRIEASGGITRRNVAAYASSGADMISSGFITSSARGIDLSMEV